PRGAPAAVAGEAAEDAAGEDCHGGRRCRTPRTPSAVAEGCGFAAAGRLLGVAFTRAIAGVARDARDRHVSPHDYASPLSGDGASGQPRADGARGAAPALDSHRDSALIASQHDGQEGVALGGALAARLLRLPSRG